MASSAVTLRLTMVVLGEWQDAHLEVRYTGVMGSQLHCLMWAYLLEFKGRNVFVQLWVAGLVFLAANTFVMLMVIRHHKHTPLFSSSVKSGSKVAIKKE